MISRDEYGREMTSRCRYYGRMLHNEMQGIVQGGVEHIDSGIDGLCKLELLSSSPTKCMRKP